MSIKNRSVHHAGRPNRTFAALSPALFRRMRFFGALHTRSHSGGTACAKRRSAERGNVSGFGLCRAVREKIVAQCLKTSALRKDTLTPLSPDSFRIEARGYNRLVAAGSIWWEPRCRWPER